jgi:low temperature requirement protein LtrA
VLAAADGYSYLHLVIVAGIIIYAGGVKLVVHAAASAPMPTTGRLALCGAWRSTCSAWLPSAGG